MNSKIILSGVLAVVLLSGCASISTVPKSEEEMNALGDDSLLHVPVDISNFPWKKVQFETVADENFGRNGLKGQTTIFTDPATGKTYDEDGQPVNEKGERILKNGYVCVPRWITSNHRVYAAPPFFSVELFGMNDCRTMRAQKSAKQKNVIATTGLIGGLLTGGAAGAAMMVGGVAASSSMTLIENITADDTM
jgi:hypothetical protein